MIITLNNFWQNSVELVERITELESFNDTPDLINIVDEIQGIKFSTNDTDSWNDLTVNIILLFSENEEFRDCFNYTEAELKLVVGDISDDESGHYIMSVYSNNTGDESEGSVFGETVEPQNASDELPFNFEDLDETAKLKAIQNYKEEFDVDLYSFLAESEEKAKEIGFEGDVTFRYSFSYSQGDGVSFTAEDGYNQEKLNALLSSKIGEENMKDSDGFDIMDYLVNEINENSGRYAFASESDVLIELYSESYNEDFEKFADEIEIVRKEVAKVYMDFCTELEREGYAFIEGKTSDESITEILKDEDFQYNVYGEKIY